jgi:hypothetical protein
MSNRKPRPLLLSAEQGDEAAARYTSGEACSSIARSFHVSSQTVSRVSMLGVFAVAINVKSAQRSRHREHGYLLSTTPFRTYTRMLPTGQAFSWLTDAYKCRPLNLPPFGSD